MKFARTENGGSLLMGKAIMACSREHRLLLLRLITRAILANCVPLYVFVFKHRRNYFLGILYEIKMGKVTIMLYIWALPVLSVSLD